MEVSVTMKMSPSAVHRSHAIGRAGVRAGDRGAGDRRAGMRAKRRPIIVKKKVTEILNDSSNLTPASKPVGRKEAPLKVVSETNTSQIIAGREYSGHALDRIALKGFNAISR